MHQKTWVLSIINWISNIFPHFSLNYHLLYHHFLLVFTFSSFLPSSRFFSLSFSLSSALYHTCHINDLHSPPPRFNLVSAHLKPLRTDVVQSRTIGFSFFEFKYLTALVLESSTSKRRPLLLFEVGITESCLGPAPSLSCLLKSCRYSKLRLLYSVSSMWCP